MDENSVCAKFAYTADDGKHTSTNYYGWYINPNPPAGLGNNKMMVGKNDRVVSKKERGWKMGNSEIENIMIDKFRISKEQSKELREKMDQYIVEFEEKELYEHLYKYLELELKKTYHVDGIGKENIKDISLKCINKKNDWNNLEGYYSFVGYILTVIGQITYFIPSKLGPVYTFLISAVVFLALNKFAMKAARQHMVFLKEFNNNFPCLVIISVIACLAINIINYFYCAPILSVVAVLGVNVGIIMLYLPTKFLKTKRR